MFSPHSAENFVAQERPGLPLKTGFLPCFPADVRTYPRLRQVWPARSG
jgi:hypothetical protein